MIGLLKRILKPKEVCGPDTTEHKTRVELAKLEESQSALRKAVDSTGFFLGDALIVRRQDDRARALHNNH